MADVLNQAFPPVNPNVIQSFNYTDIAEGTGVSVLYGFDTKTSTTTTYHLTNQTIFSSDIILTTSSTSNWNFDLTTFNLPRTIKGTALIAGMAGCYGASGGGSTVSLVATLRHVTAGGVETDLATATSPTIAIANYGYKAFGNFCLPLVVAEKHFKKGETLRLNIALTKGGGGDAALLGVDPANRAVPTIAFTLSGPDATTTQLMLNVPFKMDDVA